MFPAAVWDSQHTAAAAALDLLVGLYNQFEPIELAVRR
jgi:hypothetical protein